MPQLIVNHASVSRHAGQIRSAGNALQAQTLSSLDSRSTIAANERAQTTITTSQSATASLRQALQQAGGVIQSTGDTFYQNDRLVGGRNSGHMSVPKG